MIPRFRATILAMLLLAFVAAPAAAQGWRFDIGVNGGGSYYTNSLDEDELPFNGEAKFESGWLTGAQATYWLTDIIGIRANGTYTERPFEIQFDDVIDVNGFAFQNEIEDINLWGGTGDVMIRFAGPDETGFLGFRLLPYLTLGAGAKWVNPAGGIDVSDFDGFAVDGVPFIVGDELFVLEDDTKFMGLVGLGGDFRLARNFGIRAEIGDRIWDSPITSFDLDDGVIVSENDDVGNTIHELYGQLGLHYLLGLERREVVAAVPAPPPPPPAPEEEMITICVVDPSLPEGVAEIDAIYRPATGDTIIVVNGRELTLAEATGRAMVARDAEWFVAGEPLEVTVDGETSEFVTFGGARIVDPMDLELIGTVNGVPVYADAEDVDDLAEELDERREAQRDDDLEEVLEQDDDLREEFEEIEVLYVPLEPTGCVFQPLERVEEVRKVRG